MRVARLQAAELKMLLRHQKIATMPELKKTLGTSVDLTVFRKLRELSYLSSYSHRGRFYTLAEIAQFDALGLWSHRSVWFSRYGTLVATCQALVEQAEAGYFTGELSTLVHVVAQEPLLRLAQTGRLSREALGRRYLYCAADAARRKVQLRTRQLQESAPRWEGSIVDPARLSEEVREAVRRLFNLLNEHQRRLYAGLESLKLGHGGDTTVSALLGLDVHTVARGRREVLEGNGDQERIRNAGGGRKRLEKKRQR